MASRRRRRSTPLRTSKQDMAAARRGPQTPQTASSAFRLAFADDEFLTSDDTRGVRFQLEYLKPEFSLRARGIRSTVVLFGGARIPEPGKAAWAARNDKQKRNLEKASRYYEEARRFAQYASLTSEALGFRDYVVVTGGGPGVMEAGNRGAHDIGAPSVGFNIVLPHEQAPDGYITPELCFNFHYFAIRKMHFMMRAKALVAFPGGFGTFDELFETLTLVQTKKVLPLPIVLVGRAFWERAIDWEYLVGEGFVDPADIRLFRYAETAREAWDHIRGFYRGRDETDTST